MSYRKTLLLLAIIPLLTVPAIADDDRRDGPAREFRADLRGRGEVPVTLSAARGTLALTVSDDDASVHFVLEFSDVGTAISASHIHIGQPNVNGGVTVFFCGGGGRPACPQGEGTVEGDFTAADVIGLPTQQLEPNNLAKVSLLTPIFRRKMPGRSNCEALSNSP